jgi:predicted aldo/keto reductase-like oxidoreductase
MKTMMGAKINDLSRYEKGGASYERAAFRWVFQDPNIDALIISMKNKGLADKYMGCSGDSAFEHADAEVLRRYVEDHATDYCRNECQECESSCPYGVPIADVLRQRMYSEHYEQPRMARSGYARLEGAASACLTCENEPCKNACPYDLDIPRLTRETAKIFS